MSAQRAGGVTRWTRLAIGAQVLLVAGLATVFFGLAVWLARQPALHLRYDATRGGRESLSPELVELCEQLPDAVTAEVFFTPVPGQVGPAIAQAQGQMEGLLFIAANQYPSRFRFVMHDTGDVAATRDRMLALGLSEDNVVVVHRGSLRAVLRLSEIAEIDMVVPAPGQKAVPQLTSFRGQEALYGALRNVLQDRAPKVYFTWGHGERDLLSSAGPDLGDLREMLVADGFEVERWEPAPGQALPADCEVLAIVAPEMPLAPETLSSMRAFLARGGRLFAVPGERFAHGPGSLAELCLEYGLRIEEGHVCRPFPDRFGRPVSSGSAVLDMRIGNEGSLNSNHPVTRSLWRLSQSVRFVRSRALTPARDVGPSGVALQPLATSPRSSWIELPTSPGATSEELWSLEVEPQDSRWLAATAEFFPQSAETSGGAQGPARGRLLVIGSAIAVSSDPEVFPINRGFLLNCFNWLASREHLVSISRSQADRPIMNVAEGSAVTRVFWIVILLLPGLCLAIGSLIWWRRTR